MNFGGVIHLNKTGIFILCGLLFLLIIYSILNENGSKENLEHENINLGQLLDIAIKAAENGGQEVVAVKDDIKITSKGLTKEGLKDSVTTADFLSHCSMIGTIKHFYPSLHVISEEAKTKCEEKQSVDYHITNSVADKLENEYVNIKDITVWIDPLDATHEYTGKFYEYVTTMVCVSVQGKPVIGVIHKPFSNNTSWAWVNKANSVDLDLPKHKKRNHPKIIISRSHPGEIQKVLQKTFGNNFQLVIAAGAGYKALEVAYGNVDAYLHITAIKKWDICAGNAIINALGGKMTTKHDGIIDYTDDLNVKNEEGLIATLENHNMFLEKL